MNPLLSTQPMSIADDLPLDGYQMSYLAGFLRDFALTEVLRSTGYPVGHPPDVETAKTTVLFVRFFLSYFRQFPAVLADERLDNLFGELLASLEVDQLPHTPAETTVAAVLSEVRARIAADMASVATWDELHDEEVALASLAAQRAATAPAFDRGWVKAERERQHATAEQAAEWQAKVLEWQHKLSGIRAKGLDDVQKAVNKR